MKELETGIWVSPQIKTEDLSSYKDAGIQHIVSNRLDSEVPGQPSAEDVAQAAKDAGLEFHSLPMSPGYLSTEYIEKMRELFSKGHVLSFCASGTRSTILWAATRANEGQTPSDLIATAREAGYDISGIADLLHSLAPTE